MINSKTTLNMVIGYPLAHTQSPAMHNAIYQALHLNAVLLAFPHSTVEPLIQAIKTLNVGLTAITMPFKEIAIGHVDHCEEDAKNLQAINTIIQKNGELWGYNTDIDGIEYAFRQTDLHHKNTLILGAGGAARAMAYVLKKHDANLFWLNRTKEKALTLIQEFGGQTIDKADLSSLNIEIIINTTPVGMHPNIDKSPFSDKIFQPNQTVFDMVYNPLETKFLAQAKAAGAQIISGIEMFIAQGIRQISLWQNQDFHTPEIERLARKVLLT